MANEIRQECRCEKTSCGRAGAITTNCSCGAKCACHSTCRCGSGCGCAVAK